MEKIIYNLVFNRKKMLNSKGMALVQVEAYLNRRKKYFSTKVYLRPEQWDGKKLVVKNHPNAASLNRVIYDCIVDLENKEMKLWQQGKVVTLELLKDAFDGRLEAQTSFLEFYREEVMSSPMKESSKNNHLTTLTLLQRFKKRVLFSDISYEFIAQFELFMISKGYHLNTIAKHMKHLKRHINTAINKELIDYKQYAFRKYRIKTVESSHTHLTPEELGLLEKVKLDGRFMRHRQTLDAFLFCCYAGLRYSDFVSLTPENLVEINKNTWLIYKSIKTGTEVRLPLYLLFEGKALGILEKYAENMTDFFKLRNNSNINKELAVIAHLAGVNKRVSFHTARHTNATLLIFSGVNITTVQKLLGHKNVRTTQIYTNIMDMTIVHDLEKNRI